MNIKCCGLAGRVMAAMCASLVIGALLSAPAAHAEGYEWWVRSDPAGNDNAVVKRYDATTGAFVSDFADATGFDASAGLAFSPVTFDLYAASPATGSGGDNTVKRWNGENSTFLGDFTTGTGSASGVTFGPDGNLYVSRSSSAAVYRYDGTTGALLDSSFISGGPGSGGFGLVFGPNGDLYVARGFINAVSRYDGTTGAFIESYTTDLNFPADVTFGPDGNLYVTSYSSDTIERYHGANGAHLGAFVTAGSGGLNSPYGLRFGPDGNLYVASFDTDHVKRYDGTTGAFIDNFISIDNPSFLIFVPEPTSAALLGLGGLLLCRRTRRNGGW